MAANNEDELGQRTRELEEKIRKKLQAEHEEEKRKLVEDTFREAETKYTNENVNLREQLRKMKASFFIDCRGVELVHSLRSKRFRLVSEQKETVDGDFRF